MAINKELLDLLLCPRCRGEVRLNAAGDGLICDDCRIQYEIKDDIPIMLAEDAKTIKEEGEDF